MAYEDFTTYTEVDADGDITVTATKVDVATMSIAANSYVVKDCGIGHFTDFEHLLDFKVTLMDSNNYSGLWAISNSYYTIIAMSGANVGASLWYSHVGAVYALRLKDWTNDNEDTGTYVLNTAYYTTIERNGTTLTCKIYSDAARTNLLDTLTITCANTTYRHVFPMHGYDNNVNGRNTSCYTEKLDLQEAGIETHTPSDTAKSSDALTFKAEVPIEDTAKVSDNICFFKGLRFSIGDTAKASDDLTFKAEINIEDTAKASDLFNSDAPSLIPCGCPTFTLNGISTSILFPKPEWANPNNEISKDISLFNFWSGDIDTVDKGINTQTFTIGGTVCICGDGVWKDADTMTTWLDSIKTASNDGEKFTINELGNCLNGVYVIRNFTFNTLKGTADCFTWSLNLERVRDI